MTNTTVVIIALIVLVCALAWALNRTLRQKRELEERMPNIQHFADRWFNLTKACSRLTVLKGGREWLEYRLVNCQFEEITKAITLGADIKKRYFILFYWDKDARDKMPVGSSSEEAYFRGHGRWYGWDYWDRTRLVRSGINKNTYVRQFYDYDDVEFNDFIGKLQQAGISFVAASPDGVTRPNEKESICIPSNIADMPPGYWHEMEDIIDRVTPGALTRS
ncbi:hypothetical protein SM033_00092 [Vibrio phage vB_VpaM_sm033]|nr:hypothetical protein SM033_00092 [Vibrio phage vB_VpaM_sm033]